MLEDAARVEDCRGIFVVEGETDRTYMHRAAELNGRPELLDGVHVVAAGGAEAAFIEAVTWSGRRAAPVVVLLDSDVHGKKAKGRLTSDFKFQGTDVPTYDLWVQKGLEGVEAEDLFPETFLAAFVDQHGEDTVLSEKRHLGPRWHYGFTSAAKAAFGRHVELHATAEDLGLFVTVLELVNERFAALSKKVSAA
jgi:5S rRNA maturation endonuclease (ribonuclease M5)